MRVLILDTNYPAFLERFHAANPGLAERSAAEQEAALAAQAFGTSDFYSRNLRALGHEAAEVVTNASAILRRWAVENGFRAGIGARWSERRLSAEVLRARIERDRPDVLYVQDLNDTDAALLRAARPFVRLIAGQTAYRLRADLDLSPYDVVFTSFPHYVSLFESLGVPAEYLKLAFESTILERLGPVERTRGAVFVGGLSREHEKGARLLEEVARRVPVDFWGQGAEWLPAGSPVRARFHGEAWGLDMYRTLASARIALNRHIDVAGQFANNMRLFEATGVGALLVTDAKANLNELFVPGEEVVAYRDAKECAELVAYYLAHEDERAAIARAGQARTLREHTYSLRMRELAARLEEHLRSPRTNAYVAQPPSRLARIKAMVRPALRNVPGKATVKRWAGALLAPARPDDVQLVSTDYRAIERAQVGRALEESWRDPSIPAKQRALVNRELARTWRGDPPRVFATAAEALRATGHERGSILEVGCASGYYFEALSHMLGARLDYRGLDYSEPLVRLARRSCPDVPFLLGDATRLPLRDASMDVVLSGCVLLHLTRFEDAIRESARVARHACIFHRTPVARIPETIFFTKKAYGVETVELVFSEARLLEMFERAGLAITSALLVDERALAGVAGDVRTVTYVCRRVRVRAA